MRRTRPALITIATIAVAAALAPAAAHAVPPTLGAPTRMDSPGKAEDTPTPQPAQPEQPVQPEQPQQQVPTQPAQEQPPAQPAKAPGAKPVKAKLLISRSGSLERGKLRVRVRCARSGSLSLKATGPGRVAGARLGGASFTCKRGQGIATVRIRAAGLRRVGRVSVFTVEVAARMGARTLREVMAVSHVRRGTARAAAGRYWTNAGFGSCKTGPNHPYQELMINFYASEWSYVYWRPWVLIYTDDDGMYWYQPSGYNWYGPFGASLTNSDLFRVRLASGYQQYAIGAIEIWSNGTTDWNYLNQTFPLGAEHYGQWCYFA